MVKLIKPKISDLWFRELCMSDEETMSYNAGFDVNYYGYHFDTGCIDFPKDKWEEWHQETFSDRKKYYAYILDEKTGEFVGYVNFKKQDDGKHSMGIVIHSKFRGRGYMRPAVKLLLEKAKSKRIKKIYDSVPASRVNALKVFFDLGFEVVKEYDIKKFNKIEKCYDICKTLY